MNDIVTLNVIVVENRTLPRVEIIHQLNKMSISNILFAQYYSQAFEQINLESVDLLICGTYLSYREERALLTSLEGIGFAGGVLFINSLEQERLKRFSNKNDFYDVNILGRLARPIAANQLSQTITKHISKQQANGYNLTSADMSITGITNTNKPNAHIHKFVMV